MAGTIHRGSQEHKQHLKAVEIEKVLATLEESPVLKKGDKPGDVDPDNGPTVSEFVATGKNPKDYPPKGYNSKSSLLDIAKAIVTYNSKAADKAAAEKAAKTEALKAKIATAKPEELAALKTELAALENDK